MAKTTWATAPMKDVLPNLLRARGLSMRAFAPQVGISQSFLSRAMNNSHGKTISGSHAARIATALDLPEDYFREYRAAYVREHLLDDPVALDRAYRELRRPRD